MACQAAKTSVISPKNITKVVWYILVQLGSLNNTMSLEGWEARKPGSFRAFKASSFPAL